MNDFFQNVRGVKTFLSEKENGNMKLFSFGFEKRREQFLSQKKLDYKSLVSAKLEHVSNVVEIKDLGDKFIDYCDGLLTTRSDLILSVTVADCFPVFLFDPKQKVIGILHCGWRSVAKNIIENCLDKMKTDFSSKPGDISISIGPGIQKCHFQVEKEFKKNFLDFPDFFINKNERLFFDLNGVIVKKLISKGIDLENIKNNKRCTFCDERLWSYRRDGVDENGDIQAMMVGIILN